MRDRDAVSGGWRATSTGRSWGPLLAAGLALAAIPIGLAASRRLMRTWARDLAEQERGFRGHWALVQGVAMYARVSTGPVPADRVPVILVHGLVISSRYMVPLARRLAPDFHVYAPDLLGFGNSAKPPRTFDIPSLADILAEWMIAAGLSRAALVGNSVGCQVLAELAVRHPARVDRLVLIGPTIDPAARTARQQLARTFLNSRREPGSLGRLSMIDYAKAGIPRAVQTFRYTLQDHIEEKLPKIQVPTLVIRGACDRIVPQGWAEQVVRLLPKSRLAVIPGAAHAANYNAPLEVARILLPFLLDREAAAGRVSPARAAAQ